MGVPEEPNTKGARFDQLITKYKGKKSDIRVGGTQSDIKLPNPMLDAKGRFKRFIFVKPLQDPKEVLQRFLKGRGDVTQYCKLPTPKTTSYQYSYKGLKAVENEVNLNIGEKT